MDQLISGLMFNSTDTVFPLATVLIIDKARADSIENFDLLLMRWNIDGLEPGDIEYLLNFISCWTVNGISNPYYLTHADHDSGFELIISIENPALDSAESFITGVTLIEMMEGERIKVALDYPDAPSIEILIDSIIEWLGY